jgi:hypothetical protein
LSIGCGNAFIELELSKLDYDILVTDVSPQALQLADKKGLKTIIPDDLTSLESRPNFCFTPTSPGLITAQEVNVTKSVKTSAN